MPTRERPSESELRAALAEREAELGRVKRDSLRADAERARGEEFRERLSQRDKDLEQVRADSQRALESAEDQLAKAATRIAELTRSRPPDPEDPRPRLKKAEAEILVLRGERDELQKRRDELAQEIEGTRAASEALQAAVAARDVRVAEAGASAKAASERAELAETDAKTARSEQDRLAHAEEESRALAVGAQMRFSDLKAELSASQDELTALRVEMQKALQLEAKLRAQIAALQKDVEGEQAKAVQVAAAVKQRDEQAAAAAKAREAQHEEDARDASEQMTALTKMLGEGRTRVTSLEEQLEASHLETRKAHQELDQWRERTGQAEARVGGLQSIVDSLGRERTALRADAGSLRARAELVGPAEERAKRLAVELEELRVENDFLNQELAKLNSPGKAS